MRNYVWFLLLCSCAGGTLSNKGSFEEYQLVPASPKEEEKLRSCLQAIYREQKKFFQRKRTYMRQTADLGVDASCQEVLVGLKARRDGYLAVARINRDESTVRWTINEKNEMYEHTDADMQEDIEW